MSLNLDSAHGFTGVLSRAGGASANIVRGGAATTVTSQNTTFAIGGKLYYATSGTIGTATPTTDVNTGVAFRPLTAARSACAYVYCLTSAGALKLAQGPILLNAADSAGAVVTPPQFPTIPADHCPLSYLIVSLADTYAGAGWTIGSSNFTGITGVVASTAVDLAGLPPIAQAS